MVRVKRVLSNTEELIDLNDGLAQSVDLLSAKSDAIFGKPTDAKKSNFVAKSGNFYMCKPKTNATITVILQKVGTKDRGKSIIIKNDSTDNSYVTIVPEKGLISGSESVSLCRGESALFLVQDVESWLFFGFNGATGIAPKVPVWAKIQIRGALAGSTQTVADATWTKIGSDHTWDGYSDGVAVDDTNFIFTIADDGYYATHLHIHNTSTGAKTCKFELSKNGNRIPETLLVGQTDTDIFYDFDSTFYFENGDTIECYGWRESAGDLELEVFSLSVMKI